MNAALQHMAGTADTVASIQPTFPTLAWVEIGRASPGAASPWAVWVAALAEGGALYLTSVVADGVASVAVEFQPRRWAATRTVHKTARRLTDAPADDVLGPLLGAADAAAGAALARTITAPPARSGRDLRRGARPALHVLSR